MRYAERLYGLGDVLDGLRDRREAPRIPAGRVLRGLFLMLVVRIGSLNGLEQARPAGAWRRWLGGVLPSADTLSRVTAQLAPDDLRAVLHHVYQVRRRGKSLPPWLGDWRVLILDGHESTTSERRSCPGCLTRTIQTKNGPKTQFYHRYVLAMLRYGQGAFLLDAEPQRPGEDEMAPATRLLLRLLRHAPRAFDVVAGDALYLRSDFCRLVRDHHKHFIAVLKDDRRDLLVDARGLISLTEPVSCSRGTTACTVWDLPDLTTWTALGQPVRVVCSQEVTTVRRQRTGRDETTTSEWFWGTSLPQRQAGAPVVVEIGHGRWGIENQGFNELVNEWHADHLYRHEPTAILALLLLLFLAYNLFHTWVALNLKPALRRGRTCRFWVQRLAADFYQHLPLSAVPHPP